MTMPQRTRRDLSRFRLALRDHSERVNFYADWYKTEMGFIAGTGAVWNPSEPGTSGSVITSQIEAIN